MKIQLTSLAIAISSIIFAQNRVGEKAHYKLDKDSKRTSSMIRDGFLNSEVLEFIEKEENNIYKILMSYELNIFLSGKQVGRENLDIGENFTDGRFVNELREKGEIQTGCYKARYLGLKSIRNIDGKEYIDCDIIYFFDIKNSALNRFFKKISSGLPLSNKNFENIKITIARKQGLPVMEIARLDITGRQNGYNLKAGFDFISK